ncbi:MAG: hypothetical protein ACOYJ2_03175 [Rickettsiales bacterium]
MTQETAQNAEKLKKKRTPSKGEALFDLGVYGGMNYIGTFLLTIPVAYSLKHGALKKYYMSAHRWLTKKGMSDGLAEKVLDTTTLMQGGNLMLIPIAMAEHHKKDIVKNLNESIGDHVDPSAIEQAPEQDAWSLIKSRALAWGVVFSSMAAAGLFMGKQLGQFEEWCGEKTAKLFGAQRYRDVPTNKGERADFAKDLAAGKKVARSDLADEYAKLTSLQDDLAVGIKKIHGVDANVVIKQVKEVGRKIEGFETRRFAYGKIAAIDAFATLAAVGLLYMGTRMFGKQADGSVEGASIKAPTRLSVHKEPRQEKDDTPISGKFAERLTQEKSEAAIELRAI